MVILGPFSSRWGCRDQPWRSAESDGGGRERLPSPAGDDAGHRCLLGCDGWRVFGLGKPMENGWISWGRSYDIIFWFEKAMAGNFWLGMEKWWEMEKWRSDPKSGDLEGKSRSKKAGWLMNRETWGFSTWFNHLKWGYDGDVTNINHWLVVFLIYFPLSYFQGVVTCCNHQPGDSLHENSRLANEGSCWPDRRYWAVWSQHMALSEHV